MFALTFSPEDEAFRDELRRWLAVHLPAERAALPDDDEERRRVQRAWQRELAEGGWVGIQWPREHGGRAATIQQQIIYTEEMARVRAPEILDAISVNIVGPTLIKYGTPAQKARLLPPIRPADEVWCLGFSEPNAGSDLASLRTRAVRDGDHWVVSGQKVWASKAHFADWALVLARTDSEVPKHKGISCLIVDMTSPGVTSRPLVQISGRSEFSELFFEEVRVAVEHILGPVYERKMAPMVQSKILYVVRQVLDRIAPRDGSRAKSPLDALAEVATLPNVDEVSYKLLVQAVGVLPTGTVVEFESGEWGIVVGPSSNPKALTRPRVNLITDRNGQVFAKPRMIDLGEPTEGKRYPRITGVIEPSRARFNVTGAVIAGAKGAAPAAPAG